MDKPVVENLRQKFKGKNVLVVGLGIQGGGVGLVEFFDDLGANVTVTDLKNENQLQESINKLKDRNINYVLGKHSLKDFLGADIIFKGPSVPWDLLELKEAEKKGIPIEMEASFFMECCPARIIGVTGTRGKSTTTYLIYEVLKNTISNKKAFLGGNVPGKSTIEILKKANKEDIIVLELSSWALSAMHRKKISPHIAVFTNIYADHLNYYKTIDEYLFDKKAIYLYQSNNDFLFANKYLEEEILKDKPKSKVTFFTRQDFTSRLTYLKGEHNYENAAAALLVSKKLGLDIKVTQKIIENFKELPFRQQEIKRIGEIVIVNDSTSTSPIATVKAINTFNDRPIILILGGNSKNLPFKELLESLNKLEKIILLKGTFTDEIRDELNKNHSSKVLGEFDDLHKAIDAAWRVAEKLNSAYILFSPGATSFSMFKNEFDRGKTFSEIVEKIQ